MSRQFVQGERDLEQRVSHLDNWPDPEGSRYGYEKAVEEVAEGEQKATGAWS